MLLVLLLHHFEHTLLCGNNLLKCFGDFGSIPVDHETECTKESQVQHGLTTGHVGFHLLHKLTLLSFRSDGGYGLTRGGGLLGSELLEEFRLVVGHLFN